MTDPRYRRAIAAAFAAGGVLSLGAAFGGVVAAIAATLAQPAFALGISWWRRSRTLPKPAVLWKQDVPALLALWGVGAVALALLVAWPLGALHDSGSLAAVLGLSVAVSAALLGVWRTWPLWNEIERSDGSLTRHWRSLAGRDLSAWRGLLVAGHAGDGNVLVEEELRTGGAIDLAAAAYFGQHRRRDVQQCQQVRVPLPGVDVEQQRARGVADIGDMRRAAGQVPHQPAVDGAEQQLAALGAGLCAVDVIQDPADLGGREIGVHQKAGALADQRLMAICLELFAQGVALA